MIENQSTICLPLADTSDPVSGYHHTLAAGFHVMTDTQSQIGRKLAPRFKVQFRNADTNNEWRNSIKSYASEAEAIADAHKFGKASNECGILHIPAAKGGTEWCIVRLEREVIAEGRNP